MSWADEAIKELEAGRSVEIQARSNTMRPRIKSGALITLKPVTLAALSIGDVVLCKVRGRVYLHLVRGIKQGTCGLLVRIGSNQGSDNGLTGVVYGRAVGV